MRRTNPVQTLFVKHVQKEIARVRSLLRCLAAPGPNELVATFRREFVFPPGKFKDLATIMALKGMRKQDQQLATELFQKLTADLEGPNMSTALS